MSNRIYVFNEFSEKSKAISARLLFPLKPGDRVLRPVTFYEEQTERLGKVIKPRVHTPSYTINQHKQAIVKVRKDGERWIAAPTHKDGLTLFISGEISDLYTYFEVTSIGNKGNCAFGRAVCGNEEELVNSFKGL